MAERPLRVCLLTYRGNPRCGGQGIYIRHLSRELAALGHQVDVWSGPPYPELESETGVRLKKIPSLDLWDEEHFFRVERWRDLRDPVHRSEWIRTMTGVFDEPRSFCERVVRAYRQLAPDARHDVVHDNQSLGTGLLELQRIAPLVTTIHHPITVDRRLHLEAERSLKRWIGLRRWYRFVPMQLRVAQQLERIVTVSNKAYADIQSEFGLEPARMRVVEVGVDTDQFRPLAGVERHTDRLITTLSADVPLKGIRYLLQAFALLREDRPSLRLTVIGSTNGSSATAKLINDLGLDGSIRLTGRVSYEEIVRTYAESAVAVVPSLYEGFGLPAAEAMSCTVPVVCTRAGALPEVVGEDGSAGVIVPAGDPAGLSRAIGELLDQPELCRTMGEAGRARVEAKFTWRRTAELTVEVYRELLEEHGCTRNSLSGTPPS
jgi:glycosyltransferase involved in cell wall biosynthesis